MRFALSSSRNVAPPNANAGRKPASTVQNGGAFADAAELLPDADVTLTLKRTAGAAGFSRAAAELAQHARAGEWAVLAPPAGLGAGDMAAVAVELGQRGARVLVIPPPGADDRWAEGLEATARRHGTHPMVEQDADWAIVACLSAMASGAAAFLIWDDADRRDLSATAGRAWSAREALSARLEPAA